MRDLKHIYYILGAAALTSCADDVVNGDATEYLNGKEKTPIEVSALLDKSNGAGTRAADMEFDNGDQLIAYLRHVMWDGTNNGARTSVTADQAPRLVTFTTTGSKEWTGDDITPIGTGVPLGMTSTNTQEATDLTATPTLYWDDFSNSVDASHDLRTSGHYLQSYYGYCYNGGSSNVTTALVEANGTLGWTVATDQSSGFKTSDLLWSYEQTPVAYSHETTRAGLIIPYTHAMSKVTVEVVCGEGFDTDTENFKDASVILKDMNTVASLTAPIGTSIAVPGAENANVKDITTQKIADKTSPKVKHSFAALIAPTTMKDDQLLAEIKLVDGNNYKVILSDAVLNTSATNDWASKLKNYSAETGGITQPGVNYFITVTIKKQQISVSATIKDWSEVTAEADGEIQFSGDITTKGSIAEELKSKGFDVYQSDTTSFGTKATSVSWDAEGQKWLYTPKIYWQNSEDGEYFRALSGADADVTATADVNESLIMKQGKDVLWGTTAEHSGKDVDDNDYSYERGDQIKPRTGDVPLEFEHAMSKITVNLTTSSDAAEAVTLAGAKISIANIYDQGAIALYDGKISSFNATTTIPVSGLLAANDATEGNKIKDFVVVPQSLKYMSDSPTLVPRDGKVSFYNISELYKIGDDYYVTSSLKKTYYSEEEEAKHNADLSGAISTSTVKIPAGKYDTEEKVTAKNASLEGAVKEGDLLVYTEAEFKALKASEISKDLFDLFNFNTTYEALIQDDTQLFKEYSQEDWNTVATAIVAKKCKHNDVSAKAYNAKLTGAVKLNDEIPAVTYTDEEVKEWNSKLAGAIQAGDLKGYSLPDDPGQANKANPGDLKTNAANPKIVMLIMLKDGTTYSVDLASCTPHVDESDADSDIAWERGKHYTYTISLQKEKITFRALVKEWDEKTGSGNATLEWD